MTNSAANNNSEHNPGEEENPPDCRQSAIDPNSDPQYQRIIAGTEDNVRDMVNELGKSAAKGAAHGLASRTARWLWDQFMN